MLSYTFGDTIENDQTKIWWNYPLSILRLLYLDVVLPYQNLDVYQSSIKFSIAAEINFARKEDLFELRSL